ncbi:MAG: acyl-CoA dehydrogenase family protein [Pseudomonadales bacterium]|jgi:alkylation response protein AidB-like acyl-CoA dehydrogenase|tara:strand:- start:56 stop:1261 length:1206 start_codon:yes stop_codon:yes gene_type:complete
MTGQETAEQKEFRQQCRAWLQENRPPPTAMPLPQAAYEVTTQAHRNYLVDWQAKCFEAELIATDVSRDYGGHGHDGLQQIASSEVRRANVPYFINWIGLGMAAPTLLIHGTEAQKKTYLPTIFTGEDIWCQGFSEPGAGSDLVNLQTSAVRDGDNWVINGSKVWTSLGQLAKYMLLLARTDKNDKYNGITYFIGPMEHEGVTVKPIHKMTGEAGFNEVFLDNVVIADHMRIDEVGLGWKVAMSTLTSERGAAQGVGAVASSNSPFAAIESLIELAKRKTRNGKPMWDDSLWRDKLVKLYERTEAAAQNARRTRINALNGGAMRIPLQGKVTGTELGQELHQLALSMLGMESSLYIGDPNAENDGSWLLGYMNTYTGTISGGSSEIQRNILGERVLGLPKSK